MRNLSLRSEYQANQHLAARTPGYQGFTHNRRALKQRPKTFLAYLMWWL